MLTRNVKNNKLHAFKHVQKNQTIVTASCGYRTLNFISRWVTSLYMSIEFRLPNSGSLMQPQLVANPSLGWPFDKVLATTPCYQAGP